MGAVPVRKVTRKKISKKKTTRKKAAGKLKPSRPDLKISEQQYNFGRITKEKMKDTPVYGWPGP